MIHSRIRPTTLRDRLDASYYSPDVLANEAALLARGATALRHLIDVDRSNYGVLPPSEDYLPVGSGVPLIRGGDLDSGDIRDPEVHAPLEFRNERGTAAIGDVLLLIKGACIDSPAGVALVAERHAGSVFNGSCYRIKPLPVCDGGYLVAFCQTTQLLLQKRREIANTGIAYNAEASVLGYLVPRLALEGQRYIGDKVRQAEMLRERERVTQQQVQARLAAAVPSFDDTSRRVTRVTADSLDRRLDCQPYRSHFQALVAAVRSVKHDSLGSIADLGSGDPVPSEAFVSDGIPLVRNRDIGPSGFWSTVTAVSPTYAAGASRYAATEGLVVVGMDGEFRAQFVLDLELPLHINQRVAMISPRRMRPELLTAWLNRVEGQNQLNRWAVKTTVEHTSLEYIGSVLIPRLSDAEETELADALLTSRRAGRFAQALTLAAKLLVEALIEGRLTETDLVSAQRALEAGDRSADRGLLSGLRRDAGANAPVLFPDTDALYALLDEDPPRGGD